MVVAGSGAGNPRLPVQCAQGSISGRTRRTGGGGGRWWYMPTGIVGFGELLIVKHNDIFSAYGTTTACWWAENAVVRAGQTIAEKGSSGPIQRNLPLSRFAEGARGSLKPAALAVIVRCPARFYAVTNAEI